MKQENRSWQSLFDEAFEHFDRGFSSADKAFKAAESEPSASSGKTHTLAAKTWRRRWKMFRLFQRLAWRILFSGRVTIKL